MELFLISWFGSGLLVSIVILLHDYYIEGEDITLENITVSFLCLLLGYIGFITFLLFIIEEYVDFNKVLIKGRKNNNENTN